MWLRVGVKLFEYHGPDCLHSKKMIVDNAVAWIGSYNFDARSERWNLELVLQVAEENFVQGLAESMSRRQTFSAQVCRPDRRNLRSANVRDRLKLRLFQVWMPILRPLL